MEITMRRFLLLIILTGLLTGCASTTSPSVIHLNDLQPLPNQPAAAVVPLRVAVAAVISPQGTADSYAPLLDFLEQKLNRPVELV